MNKFPDEFANLALVFNPISLDAQFLTLKPSLDGKKCVSDRMLGDYHNDTMPLAENPQATIHGQLSLWSHLNGNFLIDTRTKIADYNVL